jgi:tetratricopeptide (TPR) repeat protein
MDNTAPEVLLDGSHGTVPPLGDDPGGNEFLSLLNSISYSFAQLAEGTRRLLPAVCLFHGVADVRVLAAFSHAPGCPARFAGISPPEWAKVMEEAAQVGLLTGLGAGMWRFHPALQMYVFGQWRDEDPADHDSVRPAATGALAAAYTVLGKWLDRQITSGNARLADQVTGLHLDTLEAMLGYTLNHQMWEEAEAIAQPLYSYWDARGLAGEADAWADRIQAATQNSDGTPPSVDSPAGSLRLFSRARSERAFRLGVSLEEQGDVEGAKDAYKQAIDSGDEDAAPKAAVNLGNLLFDQRDMQGARAAYERAIDSGHADAAPQAAFILAILLQEQGDIEGAKAACRQAIRSGHPDMAPRAAVKLGNLLGGQDDAAGAKGAYRQAISSGHPDAAPRAAYNLGILLDEQGDVAAARAAYQRAIDSGHADHAPAAAFNLGIMLAEQGDVPGARAAWQRAIDSGHADHAPAAAFNLGIMLAEQGKPDAKPPSPP